MDDGLVARTVAVRRTLLHDDRDLDVVVDGGGVVVAVARQNGAGRDRYSDAVVMFACVHRVHDVGSGDAADLRAAGSVCWQHPR